MTVQPNEPRNHHIQPKVLLRQFATGKLLKRVSKITGATDFDSIKRATRIRDANTLATDAGMDFSVEKMLARLENFYPDIISRLGNNPRSDEDESWIRALIAIQMGRDPYYRAWLSEEVTSVKAALSAALAEANPSITEDEIDEEFDHYARRDVVKSHIHPDPKNVAVAATSYLIQQYYQDMTPLSLTILEAPLYSFITADSPLFLYDRYALAERNDDEALHAGLLPETEITLPLTSRYAALLSAARARPLVAADRLQVGVVNARTVRSAREFIYTNPAYPKEYLKADLAMWWWREPLGRTL